MRPIRFRRILISESNVLAVLKEVAKIDEVRKSLGIAISHEQIIRILAYIIKFVWNYQENIFSKLVSEVIPPEGKQLVTPLLEAPQ